MSQLKIASVAAAEAAVAAAAAKEAEVLAAAEKAVADKLAAEEDKVGVRWGVTVSTRGFRRRHCPGRRS